MPPPLPGAEVPLAAVRAARKPMYMSRSHDNSLGRLGSVSHGEVKQWIIRSR